MEFQLVDRADEVFARVLALVSVAFEGVIILEVVSRLLHFFGVKWLAKVELSDCNSPLGP